MDVLVTVQVSDSDAGGSNFRNLGSQLVFNVPRLDFAGHDPPRQNSRRWMECPIRLNERRNTESFADRPALRQIQVHAHAESRRRESARDSGIKRRPVRHESRARDNAVPVALENGPVYATAQTEIVRIDNQFLHFRVATMGPLFSSFPFSESEYRLTITSPTATQNSMRIFRITANDTPSAAPYPTVLSTSAAPPSSTPTRIGTNAKKRFTTRLTVSTMKAANKDIRWTVIARMTQASTTPARTDKSSSTRIMADDILCACQKL